MKLPLLLAVAFQPLVAIGATSTAPDLMPVQNHDAPKHAPLVLAKEGKVNAAVVMRSAGTNKLLPMVEDLKAVFRLTTGAELPVITPEQAASFEGVLINIGNWEGAAAEGLVGSKMPVEGFAIKTAPGQIYIVGHDNNAVDGVPGVVSHGTAWGVSEFMERFLGARWYWPPSLDGLATTRQEVLTVPPASLSDAPIFRKRIYFPPFSPMKGYDVVHFADLLRPLREGGSYPVQLAVHTPRSWHANENYVKNRPEIFQLNEDGSRNFLMLDYAHPLTLQTYLEEIADHVNNGTPKEFIVGKTVTVSPADFGVNSQSKEARALWDPEGGRYGTASRVMADFVQRLGEAMKEKFPDMNVLYLPYLNYTLAPEGFKFAGNVYVELCGMPGLAQYKEPKIREFEQANIDKWVAITGHPITDWHYSCWPADRTMSPFEYPNVVQEYYRTNRKKTMGTFINGDNHSEWLRYHITLYTWMKVLWNPDFNVKAGVDEFAQRMFGPAADTVREIVNLQISGWEDSKWPDGVLTAKSIYEISFPKASVEKFQELFKKAHAQVKGDELLERRLAYLEAPFSDFYNEFARVIEGKGLRELNARKVASNPLVDGKLDDAVWKDAEEVQLRKLQGEEQVDPTFPTSVRAVWTTDGVTFGLRMTEPDVAGIKATVDSRDHALTWHDDCVEIYVDTAGENRGDFVQAIVNANQAVQDMKSGDDTFNFKNLKTGVHKDKDYWSMEIFVPYADLAYEKATSGGDRWGIQLTRHRTGRQGGEHPVSENQKMNAGSGGFNSNLSDFSFLNFPE